MSKTKQGGSSRLGRDSAAQRLGIKVTDGQKVKTGMIIIRQRGSKYLMGKNVKKGSDDTIYAMKDGLVKFGSKSKKLFNGTRRVAKVVSVEIGKTK
ncbi:MAG: 50S ribosomal protein L27 [Candidatus Staskawiczbacteria bacterium]|nr:50S ribosomal protein L27 [Candidatus Staskawiczbacteria bacterium]